MTKKEFEQIKQAYEDNQQARDIYETFERKLMKAGLRPEGDLNRLRLALRRQEDLLLSILEEKIMLQNLLTIYDMKDEK